MNRTFILFFIIIMPINHAYAYLDPGTGSMLLSALIGIVATLYFTLRGIYYKFKESIYSLFGVKIERNDCKIVFYSEGGSYWSSFQPILEALERLKVEAIYLTSDQKDAGLSYQGQYIKSRYIGAGNRAYAYLNMMEADICIMTTPGLDVLQIKRSKGVSHYSHIVHSPTDISLYKRYSFDYYDSIMCSGPHQKETLRKLEKKRNTKPKLLIDAGCPYMDTLYTRLESMSEIEREKDEKVVLISPTWGRNGLLTHYGMQLFQPLIDKKYNIIIRPHPQSMISESDLIEELKSQLSGHDNISWDHSNDNFDALHRSDVMISDLSGIIFDYAFIFNKPVITIEVEVDRLGTEGQYLDDIPWEVKVLPQLGHLLASNEIQQLPNIIDELIWNDDCDYKREALKEKNLYNFGCSGDVIAKELMKIRDDIDRNKNN